MRILLSWQICTIGGVETWMVGLAQSMILLGHECELFFFQRGPFEQHIPSNITAHFGELADYIRLIKRRSYDIVHSAVIDLDLGISVIRRLGAKLVLTAHGWTHGDCNAKTCDAVIGCSRWNSAAQQKLTAHRVRTIYNGVDSERFQPAIDKVGDAPIVGWVGRGRDLRQKQIQRLAEIAPTLTKSGVRIWIADPDGPDKIPPSVAKVLTQCAERWEQISPEKMPDFYQQIATSGGCLLSTSSFEGLSMAYLEAQACGCPVIGPDVVGVNESVDVQRGGMLYEPKNSPDALADLIIRTISDQPQMKQRRQACRAFVTENHSLQSCAEQYLEVYAAKVNRRRGWPEFAKRIIASPFYNYQKYADLRWGPGMRQFTAARQLSGTGDDRLARMALRESIRTAPTLFVRPKRLRPAVGILLKGRGSTRGRLAESS